MNTTVTISKESKVQWAKALDAFSKVYNEAAISSNELIKAFNKTTIIKPDFDLGVFE